MSMAFRRDSIADADPTHTIVTQQPSGVDDWETDGIIGVENRAMDVLMDRGATVRLALDSGHGQFEDVRSDLTPVAEPDRIFVGSDHEFRAVLPDDRSSVDSVLEVPADDSDAWADRLFSIDAFAVLTDGSWTYRSVPHEHHIREINADGHEGLIDELNEQLDGLRGATVEPFDGS